MSEDYKDFDPDSHDYWEGWGKEFIKGTLIFGFIIAIIAWLLDLLGIINI